MFIDGDNVLKGVAFVEEIGGFAAKVVSPTVFLRLIYFAHFSASGNDSIIKRTVIAE